MRAGRRVACGADLHVREPYQGRPGYNPSTDAIPAPLWLQSLIT
jgi:hypothetical protein